ncbi:MAG: archaellin/type IV pilin N-terminal domain-containing protein [Candidatus Aenigmatarchaeota archaeon]
MKGITPVIATILLLMITIAMVGFAFVWFQNIWVDIGGGVKNATDTQMSNMNMKIRIENAKSGVAPNASMITVRATGSENVPTSQIGVYANDIPLDCSGNWAPEILPAGATTTCTLPASDPPAFAAGSKIKASSPGTIADIITAS